jgi:hypothetical protein
MLSISAGALTVSTLAWILWRIARRKHGPW